MACVDPKDIPQSMLLPGPPRKETDAIDRLDAYSFIKKRNDGQFFRHASLGIPYRARVVEKKFRAVKLASESYRAVVYSIIISSSDH